MPSHELSDILEEVRREVGRTRNNVYPGNGSMIFALAKVKDDLALALIDKRDSRAEAIQVAATAIRIALEGESY